jgi:hypothetical protein
MARYNVPPVPLDTLTLFRSILGEVALPTTGFVRPVVTLTTQFPTEPMYVIAPGVKLESPPEPSVIKITGFTPSLIPRTAVAPACPAGTEKDSTTNTRTSKPFFMMILLLSISINY